MKGMYTHPDEPSLTGHLMIALNLSAIISPEEMKTRMASFYAHVKASPLWDPNGEMFLPGELEHRSEMTRRAHGIPIPLRLHQELLALAAELGVTRPLPAAAGVPA
jgi:LDH2 family malate/lactate/ureidoglycolate dehydrogenase